MSVIFMTFSEAVRLGFKHWKLILLLVAIDVTAFVLSWPSDTRPSDDMLHQLLAFAEALALLILDLLVIGIKPAAILCALAYPEKPWRSALQSVRTNTWTLVRVCILIAFVAALFILPVVAITQLFVALGFTPYRGKNPTLLLGTIVYLVLVKYALADPIVVIEKVNARAALEKSWKMTKSRFWYVLGCILALSAIDFISRGVFSQFGDLEVKDYVGVGYCSASAVIECFSILVAWCMYWRIRDAENAAAPAT